jgi:hypothetical protein
MINDPRLLPWIAEQKIAEAREEARRCRLALIAKSPQHDTWEITDAPLAFLRRLLAHVFRVWPPEGSDATHSGVNK